MERDDSHNTIGSLSIAHLAETRWRLSWSGPGAIVLYDARSQPPSVLPSLAPQLQSFPLHCLPIPGLPHQTSAIAIQVKTSEIGYCTQYSSCARRDHWLGFRLTALKSHHLTQVSLYIPEQLCHRFQVKLFICILCLPSHPLCDPRKILFTPRWRDIHGCCPVQSM